MTLNKIIHEEFGKLMIKRFKPTGWTIEDETKFQEIMKFTAGSKEAQSEHDLIKRITSVYQRG